MEKIIINTDGGARGNPGPAGAGAVLVTEDGNVIAEVSEFLGEKTNNQAEYQALILALQKAAEIGGKEILVKMDSELIVRQMNGQYKIKDRALAVLAAQVLALCKKFKTINFVHVRREFNKRADELVNMAIDERLKIED